MMFESDIAPLRLLNANFCDIEQMCSAVQAWNLDFRPLTSSVGIKRAGRITQVRLGPIDLGYAKLVVGLEQLGAPPQGQWTFVVPNIHMKRLWWRGHDVCNENILVFPLGSDLKSLSGPDFDIYTLSVNEDIVARVCEAYKLPLPKPFSRPEVVNPPAAALQYLRNGLCSYLDTVTPVYLSDFQQIIETLVLLWLRPPEEPKRRRPSLRGRDRSIARCLESIETRQLDNLTPAALCEIAGVSERSLQYAFLERFGTTPGTFLKARRLGAVRAALQAAQGSSARIGDLAAAHGFWHAGQFAADYWRLFGEKPSDTLKR